MTSFVKRIKEICQKYNAPEKLITEILQAWKEVSLELRESLNKILELCISEGSKQCLQCGEYKHLEPNGLCLDCLTLLELKRTKKDLLEG